MQIQPIDLTSLVATILGISVVLVPVIGLTARFALKPTVEALSRLFENRNTNQTLQLLERRMEMQEQEIEVLQHALRSLGDVQAFDRQLGTPAAPPGPTLTTSDSGTTE
jgi:hypothetical protein